MRAVVADEYGEPAVLQVREVDDPKVGSDYVLVRVQAAGINPVDYKIIGGKLDSRFPDARKDFVGDGALDASDELLHAPGRMVSIRDPVYDLEAVAEAVGEASGGKVRGKVVLRVP